VCGGEKKREEGEKKERKEVGTINYSYYINSRGGKEERERKVKKERKE